MRKCGGILMQNNDTLVVRDLIASCRWASSLLGVVGGCVYTKLGLLTLIRLAKQ